MSISGVGVAGYPVAGCETRKTERNVAGGDFADAINKAATKKETNAFRPESSDEVVQAWDKALAETGVNLHKKDKRLCYSAPVARGGISGSMKGVKAVAIGTVTYGVCKVNSVTS